MEAAEKFSWDMANVCFEKYNGSLRIVLLVIFLQKVTHTGTK
jgi:hypothetical protein